MQKAAESELLNYLTDPVTLGICMIYRNLFLLECALPPRVETSDFQRFCKQEFLPVQKFDFIGDCDLPKCLS